MQDYLAQELAVGNYVVYTYPQIGRFKVGKIEVMDDGRVVVRAEDTGSSLYTSMDSVIGIDAADLSARILRGLTY